MYKGLKMIVAGLYAFTTEELNAGLISDEPLRDNLTRTMHDSRAVLCYFNVSVQNVVLLYYDPHPQRAINYTPNTPKKYDKSVCLAHDTNRTFLIFYRTSWTFAILKSWNYRTLKSPRTSATTWASFYTETPWTSCSILSRCLESCMTWILEHSGYQQEFHNATWGETATHVTFGSLLNLGVCTA